MDNVNAVVYHGPYFNYTYTSLSNTTVFLRAACAEYYGPGSAQWNYGVSNCVLNNLSQQMLANLAQHTYILTLWPAIVSIIVAMAPDAAAIAYDNLAWSIIFALTCGAMPGWNVPPLPHQLSFATLSEARQTCETSVIDGSSDSEKISRFSTARPTASSTSTVALWIFWMASFTLWAAFLILYLYCLGDVIYVGISVQAYAAIWYIVAAAPALAEGMERLLLNNVDLYEPAVALQDCAVSALVSPPAKTTHRPQRVPTVRVEQKPESAPAYKLRTFSTGFHVWTRIAFLQLTGRAYRVLIHPAPDNFLTTLCHYCITMGRLTIFVWGSINQGSFLFLFPNDFQLVALLTFATATPRILWPDMWKRAKTGADLVVWHKPVL